MLPRLFLSFRSLKLNFMETLDSPVSLKYKTGKVFPPNAIMTGYVLIGTSLLVLIFGAIYIAPIVLLFGLWIVLSTYGVEINTENQQIIEYTLLFGVIRITKKYSYNKYRFLTILPLKETVQMYSRSSSHTNISNYYFTLCLLHGNYRNKKELTRFEQKSEAEHIAKNLCHRMNLEYFEYDPYVIREKIRNG